MFELDSKSMVNAVGSSEMDLPEFASIIGKCNNSWWLTRISRYGSCDEKTNEITHIIARNLYWYPNPWSWVEALFFVAALLHRCVLGLIIFFNKLMVFLSKMKKQNYSLELGFRYIWCLFHFFFFFFLFFFDSVCFTLLK